MDDPVHFGGGLVDGQTATVKVDVVHSEGDSFAPPDAGVGQCQDEDLALVVGHRSCEAEDLLVREIPTTLVSSLAREVACTACRVRWNPAVAHSNVEDAREDSDRTEDDAGRSWLAGVTFTDPDRDSLALA